MKYVNDKHNPNNIGPTTGGSNTLATTMIQPPQQRQQSHQLLIPHNNVVSTSRLSNPAPHSSLPQTGLPAICNPAVP